MRKILLSTSAMIGLAFATGNTNNSVANNPQDPCLKITGKTTVSTYVFNADKSVENTTANGGAGKGLTTRVENSKIKFNVKGSTEAFGGLDYSLLIALTGDTSKGKSASETVIKLENPSYGQLSFGDTQGPDGFKKLGANSVIGGLGGFSGDLKDIINVPAEVVWSNGLEGSPSKATKLVYISPRIEGLQFGVSFTPNTQQKGTTLLSQTITNSKKGFDRNNLVGLLSYENTFNGIDVGISLTGIKGDTSSATGVSKDKKTKDDIRFQKNQSWAIGGKIGYYGWEIGAEYMDNRASYANKTHYDENRDSGKIVNIGISYSFGASKVSAGAFHSTKNVGTISSLGKALNESKDQESLGKATAKIFSLTYDYKVAPGLSLFAEANHFDLQSNENAQKTQVSLAEITGDNIHPSNNANKGQILLVGTKVSF